jgi:hypothetical protein
VTGSIDSKGLARSSEGIVGLPHVLGVDGNGRINKNPSSPAYHVAKLPTWCLGSEHSEQRLRDILRRECRQESTNSFSSSYFVRSTDFPLRLFVPFLPSKFQACICHVHLHNLSRSRMRPSQWQGFSLPHWLRGRAPKTLLICDLVALWLEGERMKRRDARNTQVTPTPPEKNLPGQPSRLALISSGPSCGSKLQEHCSTVFPWREEIRMSSKSNSKSSYES